MNNNFVLYLHIAPNGKKYFGITCQRPKQRWKNGHGYKNNEHFWNAIKLYGWSNIKHVVLADDLTKEEACFFERIMIALYNTNNPNNGYNITDGGEHYNHSEETRQKISKANKGKYTGENSSMYGVRGYDNPTSKTVICITTGQCFGSAGEAARWLNINDSSNIKRCCRGEKKSAYKLPNGEKLRWCYVSDLPRPQLTESDKQHLRDLLNHRGISSAQA